MFGIVPREAILLSVAFASPGAVEEAAIPCGSVPNAGKGGGNICGIPCPEIDNQSTTIAVMGAR